MVALYCKCFPVLACELLVCAQLWPKALFSVILIIRNISFFSSLYTICSVPLIEEWRGLRGQELSDISGIPGSVFVHANGFIGGNETLSGALSMAVTTLQNRKQ